MNCVFMCKSLFHQGFCYSTSNIFCFMDGTWTKEELDSLCHQKAQPQEQNLPNLAHFSNLVFSLSTV